MKLRLRLSVATLAVTLPMIAGLVALDAQARRRAAEEDLAVNVLGRAERAGERERCEADPPAWARLPPPPGEPRPPPPGRGRMRRHRLPVRLYVYDAQRGSAQPDAPRLGADDPVAETFVSRSSMWDFMNVEIVARTPWPAGPCTFVVARGTMEPWLGAILPETRIWLLPVVGVFAAVLLALGPIVRRIRQLTRQVERSALAGYAQPVSVGGQDEIAELARAFDAAAREVRAQLAEKDRREAALRRFLADTTHDVMIPLTVLKGHLSTLQERLAATAVDPVMVSAMDEAHYIGALLHNLAVVAKLDAAEPQLVDSDVDLSALVGRVMGRHRPIAEQHQVAIDSALPDDPIVVRGDVTLLEQAASNLVYNAIRHNRPGGHVAVILEPRGRAGFLLRVVDDGPGIPAEQLARLVERGFRGSDARTRTPEGQGLGLYIVQRVAELHRLELVFRAPLAGGLEVELGGGSATPEATRGFASCRASA